MILFLFIICKEMCQLKLKTQNVAKDVQKVCYCFKSFPREFDLHESNDFANCKNINILIKIENWKLLCYQISY